ncbi:MAG: PfkB family carbohydrate kinase, partial [Dehalococcoidia bacterium]|nr:PfkB family carbohydrate kinase [Dehalococcoidia bacterium]
HLTFDVNIVDNGSPSSHIPGGASAYSALTAEKHGLSTGIVTSVGSDYPVDQLFSGVDVRTVESEHTVAFANYYDSGDRTQVLMASGSRIPQTAIPEDWTTPDVLFASPLLHELPSDCVNWFDPKISCLVPSGWLRRWGHDGEITYADMLPPFRGKKWDVIAVSESEIERLPDKQLFDLGEIICVTKGENGSRIWSNGEWIQVPIVPSKPVDFTGAGDIWATTFVIALNAGMDLEPAGKYAAAASAISIESTGLSGCPSQTEVEARLP